VPAQALARGPGADTDEAHERHRLTELIDMVEARYCRPRSIRRRPRLPSGRLHVGGNHDHAEMWSLLVDVQDQRTRFRPARLAALHGPLRSCFPALFEAPKCSFDFLEGLDAIIHREVRKLYADAELPRFAVLERKHNSMVLLYESPRHFADLAEGLISACARHYGERLSIARENLAPETGSRVRFVLERQ
jgi:hypothetical protein